LRLPRGSHCVRCSLRGRLVRRRHRLGMVIRRRDRGMWRVMARGCVRWVTGARGGIAAATGIADVDGRGLGRRRWRGHAMDLWRHHRLHGGRFT
jgi:hypothetical protein